MMLIQVVKAVAGIMLVVLAAYYFGANIQRDAWVLAWSFQLILFKLFFASIHDIFRACFIRIRNNEGLRKALESGYALLWFLMIAAAGIVLLILYCLPFITDIYAPGYTNTNEISIIQTMFFWMIPALILGQVNGILSSILNIAELYYLPEILSTISVIINIPCILLGADSMGIFILPIGYYTGTLISTGILIYFVYRKGLFVKQVSVSMALIRPFLRMALPLFGAYLVAQVVVFSEKSLVSYMPTGSNAALDYARKFIDSPNILIAVFANAIVVPIIGKYMQHGNATALSDMKFIEFSRLLLLILSPLLVVFCIGNEDLISLLLFRGNFDASWVKPTAKALLFFGAGLPGLILFVFAGQYLLLRDRPGQYAALHISTQIIQLFINYFLFSTMGIATFAFSWSFTNCICAFFMLYTLNKTAEIPMIRQLVPVLGLSILALGITYGLHASMTSGSHLLRLIMCTASYCITLFIFSYIFKIREVSTLRKYFVRSA